MHAYMHHMKGLVRILSSLHECMLWPGHVHVCWDACMQARLRRCAV